MSGDGGVLVTVAAIGALAPTIAAIGAWRSSRKNNLAVNNRPSEAPTISDDVAAIRVEVSRLRDRFDEHMRDHVRTRRRR
jgi:hypothetical protein